MHLDRTPCDWAVFPPSSFLNQHNKTTRRMHSLMVRTAWQEKTKTKKKSVSHLSITPTTRSDIGARGTICNMRAHNKPRGHPAFVRFKNTIAHTSMLENSLQQYCAQYSSLISFPSRICTAPKKKNGSHTCLYLFPRFSILVHLLQCLLYAELMQLIHNSGIHSGIAFCFSQVL